MSVKPIPDGFHSVTPYVIVDGAAKAIEFYKKAFGAIELARMNGPDGKVGHAEIRIGNSPVMLGEQCPERGARAPQGGSPVGLLIYVPNVDALAKQAVAAGAKEVKPVMDQFWGDRYGMFVDPFGHQWAVVTHKEDVTPEEMQKRAQAMFAGMGKGKP